MFEETHPLPEYDVRPLKVFVSSVVSEFEDERAQLVELIHDLDMIPVYCEDPLEDGNRQQPIPVCMGMVRDADVVMFLFGRDYAGRSILESELSTTEKEYVRAVESGKCCLYFLKNNVTEVHPRMLKLRRQVAGSHWCRFFGSIDELVKQARIDLVKIKSEWDFPNETVDGWLFITQMVEYYSDRDMSDELRSEGREMLLKILDVDELPRIPNIEIEDLMPREDATSDIERLERFRRKGQMSQMEFDQKRARAIERACALNISSHCLLKIDELLRRYTGKRISSEDLNGPIQTWVCECFGENQKA